MKKSAKILTVALGAAMAVSSVGFLGGCADKDSRTVLRVAGFQGGYGRAYWESLEKGFEEAYPDVNVELTVEFTLEETIQPQLNAHSGPDVIYCATGRPKKLTESLINSNKILDLTDLMKENVYNERVTLEERMMANLMGTSLTNPYADQANKTYMLPLFFSANGLFFNGSLFVEHAETYTPIVGEKYMLPETWDEFFALGDALKEKRKTVASTPYLFTYPTAGYFDTMLPASLAASAGIATVNEMWNYENVWATTGNDDVKEVMTNIATLVKTSNGYLEPNTVGQANQESFQKNQNAIQMNKALFMPNGDWVVDEMSSHPTAAGFAWANMPYLASEAGGIRYGTTNLEQIYINKESNQIDLAKKFLLYVYSNDGLSRIAGKSNSGMIASPKFYEIASTNEDFTEGKIAGYAGYFDGTTNILAGNFASATVVGDFNMGDALYAVSITKLANNQLTVDAWMTLLKDTAAAYTVNK